MNPQGFLDVHPFKWFIHAVFHHHEGSEKVSDTSPDLALIIK
jgi:hypothetical protein